MDNIRIRDLKETVDEGKPFSIYKTRGGKYGFAVYGNKNSGYSYEYINDRGGGFFNTWEDLIAALAWKWFDDPSLTCVEGEVLTGPIFYVPKTWSIYSVNDRRTKVPAGPFKGGFEFMIVLSPKGWKELQAVAEE